MAVVGFAVFKFYQLRSEQRWTKKEKVGELEGTRRGREGGRTIGLPWAAFKSDSGSYEPNIYYQIFIRKSVSWTYHSDRASPSFLHFASLH